ncbi:MAG: hypothetical protein WC600_17120 [Desulfobaccales bacterium]
MIPPLLIGLSGKAGSGKSTAADYLWDQYLYHRFAFADTLKVLVGQAFDFSQEQLYGDLKEVPDPRFGKSPRWCLQHLGTEVFRGIWPGIWVHHLMESVRDFWQMNGERPVVVTDVRFLDEAEALKNVGAVLIRIERAGAGAQAGIPDHISETSLDAYPGWDYVLQNDGSLAALEFMLDQIVGGVT